MYLSDDSLSALPRAGYSTSHYRMAGAAATRLVEDGEQTQVRGLGSACRL